MKKILFGAGLVAVLAWPAMSAAQHRAFVGLFVGGTIGNEGGGAYGGAFGVRATDRITIFGEFGRLTNLLPKSAADEIQTVAARVAATLGGSASPIAKTRTNYGLVGGRVRTDFLRGVETFIELGAGMGRVSTDLTVALRGSETAQGDISHLVSTPFTSARTTKPVMTIGGGIVLDVTSRTSVEAGIGYLRVFTNSPALGAARIYGTYRVGF